MSQGNPLAHRTSHRLVGIDHRPLRRRRRHRVRAGADRHRLAIAWRPRSKVGLGVSVAWSVGVWWIGEGLGGVLNGTANPVNGAPGAVMIYALLAVLLWPSDRAGRRRPVRRRPGRGRARRPRDCGWCCGVRSPTSPWSAPTVRREGLHDLIGDQAAGEPGWVAWIDRTRPPASTTGAWPPPWCAALLAVVAVGIYLPPTLANVLGGGDGGRCRVLGGRRELRGAIHQRGHGCELGPAPGAAGRRLLEPFARSRAWPRAVGRAAPAPEEPEVSGAELAERLVRRADGGGGRLQRRPPGGGAGRGRVRPISISTWPTS